jgi:thiamine transport system permease protein
MDDGRSQLGPRAARLGAAVVPLAFLAVFFIYPVASIIGRGFSASGSPPSSSVGRVLTDATTWHTLTFTVGQAALSTVVTLAVGIPIAGVYARVRFPGRALFAAFITIPFVLPTIVVAAAFRALGASPGFWPIIAANSFFNVAVVVRTVGTTWSTIDSRPYDAARVLGASRVVAAWTTTWPRLRVAIASAATIVFLFCFTSFGVILVLGGPTFQTLETEIYRQWAQRLDLGAAAALSILQMLTVLVVLTVSGTLARRVATGRTATAGERRRPPRDATQWLGSVTVIVVAIAALGAPMVALVREALSTPTGLSLGNFRALSGSNGQSALFVPVTDALRNSIEIAVAATIIAVLVGGLAALTIAGRGQGRAGRAASAGPGERGRQAFDLLATLPLGTSAVTVGFGFLVALDTGVLDLRTSPWIIPIAHALIGIPFVVRTMVPALRTIDPRLHEAAAVLGASPARVRWTVDVPIIRRAVLVAAGFAFAISLGEFGATLFIARPDRPTLPVEIFRLLSLPGAQNYGMAMAASTILMALTATAMVLIERARVPNAAGF